MGVQGARRSIKHGPAWRARRSLAATLAVVGAIVLVAAGLGVVPLVVGPLAVFALAAGMWLGLQLRRDLYFNEESATVVGVLGTEEFDFSDLSEIEVDQAMGQTRVIARLVDGSAVRLAALEPFCHGVARHLGREAELRSWRTMEDCIDVLERRRRRASTV